MRRLYVRFYLALLGSLVLFALVAAALWHRAGGPVDHAYEALSRVIQNILPPVSAPPADQQRALARMLDGLHANAVLLSADRRILAQVGEPLSIGNLPGDSGYFQHPRNGTLWALRLPDQRRLMVSVPVTFNRPEHVILLSLLGLALAVGVMAFPLVRHLAKRLERLQHGVERLGAGDLRARVVVEGNDEVARLAECFNQSAARVEDLVRANKALLANASHELRTPLTRIRLAIELVKDSVEPKRREGLARDIAELDQLIDEILLASRLDAVTDQSKTETVDLLALAAEEGARYDAVQVEGTPLSLVGDAKLLRRMIRNLLENAYRHGAPPVLLKLYQAGHLAKIEVHDAGAGVPEIERERIFEPFYRRSGANQNVGNGLGLALVRQIARRHGGDACCEMGADGHTFFMIHLASA